MGCGLKAHCTKKNGWLLQFFVCVSLILPAFLLLARPYLRHLQGMIHYIVSQQCSSVSVLSIQPYISPLCTNCLSGSHQNSLWKLQPSACLALEAGCGTHCGPAGAPGGAPGQLRAWPASHRPPLLRHAPAGSLCPAGAASGRARPALLPARHCGPAGGCRPGPAAQHSRPLRDGGWLSTSVIACRSRSVWKAAGRTSCLL